MIKPQVENPNSSKNVRVERGLRNHLVQWLWNTFCEPSFKLHQELGFYKFLGLTLGNFDSVEEEEKSVFYKSILLWFIIENHQEPHVLIRRVLRRELDWGGNLADLLLRDGAWLGVAGHWRCGLERCIALLKSSLFFLFLSTRTWADFPILCSSTMTPTMHKLKLLKCEPK